MQAPGEQELRLHWVIVAPDGVNVLGTRLIGVRLRRRNAPSSTIPADDVLSWLERFARQLIREGTHCLDGSQQTMFEY